jgi:hypothetical protein
MTIKPPSSGFFMAGQTLRLNFKGKIRIPEFFRFVCRFGSSVASRMPLAQRRRARSVTSEGATGRGQILRLNFKGKI